MKLMIYEAKNVRSVKGMSHIECMKWKIDSMLTTQTNNFNIHYN